MKTDFRFDCSLTWIAGKGGSAKASIIGKAPEHKPFVAITVCNAENTLADLYIKDKDLERFAVNILKAMKSKRLKT